MRTPAKASVCLFAVTCLLVLGFASHGVAAEIVKWLQPPDFETGLDLQSQWDPTDSEPDIIKADDWLCADGVPITSVRWWGSYIDNVEFYPDGFAVLIYDDFDDPGGFHEPGTLLADHFGTLHDVQETVIGFDIVGEAVYEYTLDLATPFCQEAGNRYWISIVAITPDNDTTPIWGWHTGLQLPGTESEWAVTGKVWHEMTPSIPVGNPDEWVAIDRDMAFELTAVPEPATVCLVAGLLLTLLLRRRAR